MNDRDLLLCKNEKEGIYIACHSPHKSGGLLLEYCVVQAGMELTVQHRLATKSQSSCLSIPNAKELTTYLTKTCLISLYLSKMFSLILFPYCLCLFYFLFQRIL